MAVERERRISVSSGGDELRARGPRLQPPRYAGPPGTYRTLTAVDSAVMVLDALPAQTQGSINSSRQPAKSPTFRVARAAPRDRVMAAMRASASEIGRPARRRLGDLCELTSCGAVEGQYATRQNLRENQVYNRRQGLPPPALGQQRDAVEQLRLSDR